MTSLYTQERLKRMERRMKTGRALLWALSAASAAACVSLCLNTRMGNERTMFISTVTVSVLGGWTAMALTFFWWLPSRAEYRHMLGIMQGEEEEAEGVLNLTDTYFSIPRSITVRRASLETDRKDGGTLQLQVDAALGRSLPPSGTCVKVRFVRKYITAWEEKDAEAQKNR